MKIFRLCFQHNERGYVLSYHGSHAQAEVAFLVEQRQAKREGYDASNPLITECEIKPTKRDVLRFLNCRTPGTDNG